MDFLKKLFPYSFNCQEKDNFIKSLVIHIIAMIAAGVAVAVTGIILGKIPFVGDIIVYLVGLAAGLIELYATAGIVFSILVFVKVFK